MSNELPPGFGFHKGRQLYYARIELPPRNGQRRRKTIYGKTLPELKTKLKDPLQQFLAHGDLPTGNTKLGDYIEYWYQNIGLQKLRPKTAQGYIGELRRHVIPVIGSVKIAKVTPQHLRRVYTHITSTPKYASKPNGPFLSSSTAYTVHRMLGSVLTDAERDGLIARNPTKIVDAPRKGVPKLEALTVAEAKHVIKAVAAEFTATGVYNMRPMLWATFLLTGARRGEIIGLEESRVGDTIELSWQLQRIQRTDEVPADFEYRHIQNGMYWTRPKTQAGVRVIPLVQPLKALLEAHMALTEHNDHGLVFSYRGRPIDPDTASDWWAKDLKRYGIDKHVRLHDLRHTTVDLLYEAGVPEDLITEIIGHANRSVTRGYKSPQNLARRRAGMEQLSRLLELEGDPT